MKTPFINCELPISLLHKVRNEYEFVLFHLLENDDYKAFMMNTQSNIILDNSGYEYAMRGLSLDVNAYKDAIKMLRPNLYIVPDVLGDGQKTQDLVLDWYNYHQNEIPYTPMPVCQGSSLYEMKQALNLYLMLGYRAVAIPFHLEWYTHRQEGTLDERYAKGRVKFCWDVQYLLNQFQHVHLLGSHDVKEVNMYPDCIKTIDTSLPVKCAIEGKPILIDGFEKPDILIDDFFTMNIDADMENRIITNINRFRTYRDSTY